MPGSVAIVHHDHRDPPLRHQRRHVRIFLQPPDVVDDRCALVERPRGNRSLDGIDRHRQAKFDDLGYDGRQPRLFVFRRYRDRIIIRARRLRADIEDVDSLASHIGGMRDGNRRIEEPATIGEGIRSDVEDTHDQRAAGREQRRKRERKWI
jgi:hypothetical protein